MKRFISLLISFIIFTHGFFIHAGTYTFLAPPGGLFSNVSTKITDPYLEKFIQDMPRLPGTKKIIIINDRSADLNEIGKVELFLIDWDETISMLKKGWSELMTKFAAKIFSSPSHIKPSQVWDMHTIHPDATDTKFAEEFVKRTTGAPTIVQFASMIEIKNHKLHNGTISNQFFENILNGIQEKTKGDIPTNIVQEADLCYKKWLLILEQDLRNPKLEAIRRNNNPDSYLIGHIRLFLEYLNEFYTYVRVADEVPVYPVSGSEFSHVNEEARILKIQPLVNTVFGYNGPYEKATDLHYSKGGVADYLCEKENILPFEMSKVIFVGDGPNEMSAGKKRGAITVGLVPAHVKDKLGLFLRLSEAGADYIIIDDFSDYKAFVDYFCGDKKIALKKYIFSFFRQSFPSTAFFLIHAHDAFNCGRYIKARTIISRLEEKFEGFRWYKNALKTKKTDSLLADFRSFVKKCLETGFYPHDFTETNWEKVVAIKQTLYSAITKRVLALYPDLAELLTHIKQGNIITVRNASNQLPVELFEYMQRTGVVNLGTGEKYPLTEETAVYDIAAKLNSLSFIKKPAEISIIDIDGTYHCHITCERQTIKSLSLTGIIHRLKKYFAALEWYNAIKKIPGIHNMSKRSKLSILLPKRIYFGFNAENPELLASMWTQIDDITTRIFEKDQREKVPHFILSDEKLRGYISMLPIAFPDTRTAQFHEFDDPAKSHRRVIRSNGRASLVNSN